MRRAILLAVFLAACDHQRPTTPQAPAATRTPAQEAADERTPSTKPAPWQGPRPFGYSPDESSSMPVHTPHL